MTRKDYELLSRALRRANERAAGNADARRGVRYAAEAVGDALQEQTPRFDFLRFLHDAGVPIP